MDQRLGHFSLGGGHSAGQQGTSAQPLRRAS
jgi:hypothetical protein